MPKDIFVNDSNKTLFMVFIILLSIIISITAFKIHDRDLMSKSIDSAIEKGVNPMAVRCSYASETDAVCVAFASLEQKQQEVANANKR